MGPNTAPGIAVRLAHVDEAPRVLEIMLSAYEEYKGKLPTDSGAHTETVDDVLTDMHAGGAVLAEDDGKPIGCARFVLYDDVMYVGRLAVLSTHRRRGAATAMMHFLEDVARRAARPAIRIGVRGSLPSNVALYERLGYDVVSVEPHHRGADTVITMVKKLDTALYTARRPSS